MDVIQEVKQSLTDIAELLESHGGEFALARCTEPATVREQLVGDLRDLIKRCQDLRCRIENAVKLNKSAKTIGRCDANASAVGPSSERPEPSASKLPKPLIHHGEEGLSSPEALSEAQGTPIVTKSTSKRQRKSHGGSNMRSVRVQEESRPTQPAHPSSACHPPQAPATSARTHRSSQSSSTARVVHHGLSTQDLKVFRDTMKTFKLHLKNNPNIRVNKIDDIRTEKNIVNGVTTSGTATTINVGGSNNSGSSGFSDDTR
ncbi:hypothetical protein J3A83DRAFT_4369429 [Scleroderma citrinum]